MVVVVLGVFSAANVAVCTDKGIGSGIGSGVDVIDVEVVIDVCGADVVVIIVDIMDSGVVGGSVVAAGAVAVADMISSIGRCNAGVIVCCDWWCCWW